MKQGWEIKKLGEICKIKTGKKDVNQGNPDGKYPFFTCAKDHTYSDGYSFDTEALLIAGNGDVGNVSYYKGKFEAYQRTYVLFDFNGILPRFLFLILEGFLKSKMSDQKLGNTMPYIKLGMLIDFEVPIPPLSEQKEIVAILDKAFTDIAKAKENAEQNLKNTKELFESYLQSVFSNKGDGWEERKLGDSDLIEIIDGDRGKNYPKKKDFLEEGFCLFMNTKNVRPDGLEFDTKMFITEKKDNTMGKGKLKRFDVVMTTRGTIGNLGVYDNSIEYENIRINSGMLIFRPNQKLLASSYFFEIMRSGIIKKQIIEHISGAAQPQLPIKTLINFTFPLPKSIKEQEVIVKKLDNLSIETKKLESIYQQKINDLEELKKSILQKAFNGELKSVKV